MRLSKFLIQMNLVLLFCTVAVAKLSDETEVDYARAASICKAQLTTLSIWSERRATHGALPTDPEEQTASIHHYFQNEFIKYKLRDYIWDVLPPSEINDLTEDQMPPIAEKIWEKIMERRRVLSSEIWTGIGGLDFDDKRLSPSEHHNKFVEWLKKTDLEDSFRQRYSADTNTKKNGPSFYSDITSRSVILKMIDENPSWRQWAIERIAEKLPEFSTGIYMSEVKPSAEPPKPGRLARLFYKKNRPPPAPEVKPMLLPQIKSSLKINFDFKGVAKKTPLIDLKTPSTAEHFGADLEEGATALGARVGRLTLPNEEAARLSVLIGAALEDHESIFASIGSHLSASLVTYQKHLRSRHDDAQSVQEDFDNLILAFENHIIYLKTFLTQTQSLQAADTIEMKIRELEKFENSVGSMENVISSVQNLSGAERSAIANFLNVLAIRLAHSAGDIPGEDDRKDLRALLEMIK